MDLKTLIQQYLDYCKQRSLDSKTLKAYRLDLGQFSGYVNVSSVLEITPVVVENFLTQLQRQFKPPTVKRKIASLKLFFHYLDNMQLIEENPFCEIQISFSLPENFPETLPLAVIADLFTVVNNQCCQAKTELQRKMALRDSAVIHLLFKTGIRISELCSLVQEDVDLKNGILSIHGKGLRNRQLKVGKNMLVVLQDYQRAFQEDIDACGYFFVNRDQKPLSDQVVRRLIQKYVPLDSSGRKITPKVLRNTLAAYLLESGEDIHYVQRLFGHSSINVTEYYSKPVQESFSCIAIPSL